MKFDPGSFQHLTHCKSMKSCWQCIKTPMGMLIGGGYCKVLAGVKKAYNYKTFDGVSWKNRKEFCTKKIREMIQGE